MWNPHPTISKPVPIGKKHTNQPRTKARQRQENNRARSNKEKLRRIKAWKAKVHAYWIGLTDEYPNPPNFN